jgi:hypothetical protein
MGLRSLGAGDDEGGEVLRPVRPSVLSGPGPGTGGAVFSRLSKLLNQENALGAPCLRDNSCSPQAPVAERRNTAERLHPLLSMSDYCWQHRVIIFISADAFGGRCTGRARRCKAKQSRRVKTALMCEYLLAH